MEALFNFLINENDSADLTNEQHEVLRWTNFTIQKVNIDFNPVEIYSLFLNGEENFLQHFHHEICSTVSSYDNIYEVSCGNKFYSNFKQAYLIYLNCLQGNCSGFLCMQDSTVYLCPYAVA